MSSGLDEAVARWCTDHRVGWLDDVTVWLAEASEMLGVIALVLVLWVCAAVWFGGWRPMLQVVGALAAVSVLTGWLKPAIDRPRPSGDLALMDIPGSAMPSSHALITSAFVVAVVLAEWWSSERLQRAAVVAGALGCVLVAAAMVYMGAHWVTDVLVGWALGVGLTWPLMLLARRVPDGSPPVRVSER